MTTHHGAGAVWDDSRQGLRCVDVFAGDVLLVRRGEEVERAHVAGLVTLWRPTASGGEIVVTERGFRLGRADGTVDDLGPLWTGNTTLRMTDGTCDPSGVLYCGSMTHDARPGAGALWRLSPDLRARPVITGVTLSSGLAWSPTGERAYYVDSALQRIDALTFDLAGDVCAREPFVTIDPSMGTPSGLTVDAEGGVWIAMWGGGAVHRFGPNGRWDDGVRVGPVNVTGVTFGGALMDQLFVTTSRLGAGQRSNQCEGAIFSAFVGVQGTAATPFSV